MAYVTREDLLLQRRARDYHRQLLELPQLPVRRWDNAYIVEDSLDAGRLWNHVPPSLADVSDLDELDCLPPGEDRQGLAEFNLIQGVATIAGAAFQAGGAVGAALISADAQKYAVRQQTKSEMMIALARAKSELEQTKATVQANVDISRENTKQKVVESEASTQQVKDVSTSVVPIMGLLGAGAIAAWILLKD